ncbi:MAG: DNA-binding response regulator [Acidobacteria bacterium]|nr:MAG: DNA-binding response regulator [Acidobacteriota bacterium]
MRRVLLVDDHPVVRQGIRRVLAEGLPDVMIGEADTGPAALAKMEDGAWDAVLLDLTLRGPDGLEVLRTLHTTYPSVPVLIVSMHPAEQFAHRAITAGAAGYLTKDADPGELIKIVAGVLKGKRYPAEAADPDDLTAAARAAHEALSDREYQVLRMIARGRTVSQIAAELGLSVKTVSTYRSRILEKMKMTSTAELMHYAISNRLV